MEIYRFNKKLFCLLFTRQARFEVIHSLFAIEKIGNFEFFLCQLQLGEAKALKLLRVSDESVKWAA